MKKSLLFLLMFAITAVFSTQAATNYGINVGGVEVSSSNYSNVTGGNINGGTVKYDPSNKILTLTGVSISRTGGDNYGVHNRSVDGLTIRFAGTNNITCDKANALHLDKSTTVSITGTLNAKMSAGENYGRGVIYVNDATVWFQGGGTLNVTGNMKNGGSQSNCATAGFEGKGKTNSSYLNISNLNVVMNVTHSGIHKFRTVNIHSGDVKITYTYGFQSISDVGGFNLNNGVACVTPADATFNSSNGYFGGNDKYTHFTNSYGAIISTANFPNEEFRSYMRSICSYEGSSIYREQYLTVNQLQNLTSLDVSSKVITNLTGVNLLSYLTTLNCSNNAISSLPALPSSLKSLNCSSNRLTSLGTLPSSLQTLNCSSNWFTGILTVIGLSALKTLDASNNIHLTTINCYNNALTSLNVSGCSALTSLDCKSNQLTSLGTLPRSLRTLNCSDNKFTSLTVTDFGSLTTLNVSKNTALTSLHCNDNALTSLNVSGCSALTLLNCRSNKLTSLETLSTSLKELYCSSNKFVSLSVTDKALKTLDVSDNTDLTSLNCSNNALTSLNVKGCSALSNLNCNSNQLTSLGTLPNSLEALYCGSNRFSSLTVTDLSALRNLDVNNNTALTTLDCSRNALTYLGLSGCTALTSLFCSINQLPSLNTLPNSVQTLFCGSNKFTSLDLSNRSALKSLVLPNCSNLTTLKCNNSALSELNISGCSSLEDLQCYHNELSSLNVQGLTALKTINAFSNNLTSLSVQGCSALNYLNIRANQIKGTSMTSLINSMRTIPSTEAEGTFYVYGENYSGDKPEGNVITFEQVNAAKAKRWLPQHKVGDYWMDITVRGDLNGDGEVDVTDVSILIDVVLGKPNSALKPDAVTDLDGNGMIDVSDVGIIIDIVLGKG